MRLQEAEMKARAAEQALAQQSRMAALEKALRDAMPGWFGTWTDRSTATLQTAIAQAEAAFPPEGSSLQAALLEAKAALRSQKEAKAKQEADERARKEAEERASKEFSRWQASSHCKLEQGNMAITRRSRAPAVQMTRGCSCEWKVSSPCPGGTRCASGTTTTRVLMGVGCLASQRRPAWIRPCKIGADATSTKACR